MAGKRKIMEKAVISGLWVLAFLACPVLPAQTNVAKPASQRAELPLPKCDPSLLNPVPGESIVDASRRLKAWNACEDKARAMEFLRQRLWKKADLNNGALKVAATAEVGIPGLVIERANVYVRNISPAKQAYTLTVTCGEWSKTVSGSLDAAESSQANQAFGKPAYTLEVSPPCNAVDSGLELSWPNEIQGRLENESTPVVPLAWDTETVKGPGAPKGEEGRTASQVVSSSQRKVNEACKQPSVAELANSPTSIIGKNMATCAKAIDEAEAALAASHPDSDTIQSSAPTDGAMLVVTAANEYYQPGSGYRHIEGEVKNVAGQSLKNVEAVVSYYTADGEYVTTERNLIEFQPILSNQTSPFQILTPGNPAITRWKLQFQIMGGGTLPSAFRTNSR
jgi:hypothetical protein